MQNIKKEQYQTEQFNEICSNDSIKEINGYKKEVIIYAAFRFFRENKVFEEYIMPTNIAQRYREIGTLQKIDLQSINKYLTTTDKKYQDVEINEDLEKAILEGMFIVNPNNKYGVKNVTNKKYILEPKYEGISYIPATKDFLVDSIEEISDSVDTSIDKINASIATIDTNYATVNTTLSKKVDKISGKQLSTNDYTTAEKNKLAGIASGATKIQYVYEASTGRQRFNYSGNKASANYTHAEGYDTTASGAYSHAEGHATTASGLSSHAEGFHTTAVGEDSHAEGNQSYASGKYAHAEGWISNATGISSHAEGCQTTASGVYAHAEGFYTKAIGQSSHAEGTGAKASSDNQHAQGKYNIEDAVSKYAHIVGNGTSTSPSNAHTIDWNGLGWFASGLKIGGTGQDDEAAIEVAIKTDIPVNVSELTNDAGYLVSEKLDSVVSEIANESVSFEEYGGILDDIQELTYRCEVYNRDVLELTATIGMNVIELDYGSLFLNSIQFTPSYNVMDGAFEPLLIEWLNGSDEYDIRFYDNDSNNIVSIPTGYYHFGPYFFYYSAEGKQGALLHVFMGERNVTTEYSVLITEYFRHKTHQLKNDIPDTSGFINIPTASVGQTITVKAVDENGRPTEWEAVEPMTALGLKTEQWTFTLEDGTEVIKNVVIL